MDTFTDAPTTRTFPNDIQCNLDVSFMDTTGAFLTLDDIESDLVKTEYSIMTLIRITYEQEWTAWQKENFDCHNKVSPRKIMNLVIPISEIKGILSGYNCDGTYMCKIDCGSDSKGGYVFYVSEPKDVETIQRTLKILYRILK